jgi:hypothetical protein
MATKKAEAKKASSKKTATKKAPAKKAAKKATKKSSTRKYSPSASKNVETEMKDEEGHAEEWTQWQEGDQSEASDCNWFVRGAEGWQEGSAPTQERIGNDGGCKIPGDA